MNYSRPTPSGFIVLFFKERLIFETQTCLTENVTRSVTVTLIKFIVYVVPLFAFFDKEKRKQNKNKNK